MVCWRMWAGGRWEGSVVQARVWSVLEAGSLSEHVSGSGEGKDKQSQHCHAQIGMSAVARPWSRRGFPACVFLCFINPILRNRYGRDGRGHAPIGMAATVHPWCRLSLTRCDIQKKIRKFFTFPVPVPPSPQSSEAQTTE